MLNRLLSDLFDSFLKIVFTDENPPAESTEAKLVKAFRKRLKLYSYGKLGGKKKPEEKPDPDCTFTPKLTKKARVSCIAILNIVLIFRQEAGVAESTIQ